MSGQRENPRRPRRPRQRPENPLRWALEASNDPAVAAADWLARDIDPTHSSAVAMLTSPGLPLDRLRQAKDVYKTMRVIGETPADRHMGGRLYLAAIAAAIVFHRTRITRQSGGALERALREMSEDPRAPTALCRLASDALGLLNRHDLPRASADDHVAGTAEATPLPGAAPGGRPRGQGGARGPNGNDL